MQHSQIDISTPQGRQPLAALDKLKLIEFRVGEPERNQRYKHKAGIKYHAGHGEESGKHRRYPFIVGRKKRGPWVQGRGRRKVPAIPVGGRNPGRWVTK